MNTIGAVRFWGVGGETLRHALSRLNALDASRADEKARAIMYLAMSILHLRSPEERQNLITFMA